MVTHYVNVVTHCVIVVTHYITGSVSGEGMSNAVTLIMMSGADLASVSYNKMWQSDGHNPEDRPLFGNAFYPYSTNGMRLMINSRSVTPTMDQQGIVKITPNL